jgi:hypothetical protein
VSVYDVVEEKTWNQELRAAQLVMYDLEEEKSAWLLMVRQALVEWEFMDSSLRKCFPSKAKVQLANGIDGGRSGGAHETTAPGGNDNPFDSDEEDGGKRAAKPDTTAQAAAGAHAKSLPQCKHLLVSISFIFCAVDDTLICFFPVTVPHFVGFAGAFANAMVSVIDRQAGHTISRVMLKVAAGLKSNVVALEKLIDVADEVDKIRGKRLLS